MNESRIRAVVFQDGERWIVQFLEYDLVTVTRRLEDVPGEVRRFLLVLMVASLRRGIEPFEGFTPAPRKYWEMFEKATVMEEVRLEPPPELEIAAEPRVDARLAA
jgi:hypothetical protein